MDLSSPESLDIFGLTLDETPMLDDMSQDSVWKGTVQEKLEKAAPYYFFLTRVQDCFETFSEDLTISFRELLDPSLGTLEHSLHINFMVDMAWLLTEYGSMDLFFSPMTIVCGVDEEDPTPRDLEWSVRTYRVRPQSRFGKMHAKMSIFLYTDKSLRFVIYTANLVEAEWKNRTQGVWVSPRCPFMGNDIPINFGESKSFFKVDIIHFLRSYNLDDIREWIVRIQKCDLSAIRVSIVASVPGNHEDERFGYKKLNAVLKLNCSATRITEWDFVAQCSSIGSLGKSPQDWYDVFSRMLQGYFVGKHAPAKLIFPSVNNVIFSLDGLEGATCLPYSSKVHRKQMWIRDYLYQWKSEHRSRTRALPHIKSYAGLSKDGTRLSWFLLTSANLSKAAWGNQRANGKYSILSHELGVLFLPSAFNVGNTFRIKKGGYVGEDTESFPLPYDAPILPYAEDDRVFLYDKFC